MMEIIPQTASSSATPILRTLAIRNTLVSIEEAGSIHVQVKTEKKFFSSQ